MSLTSIASAFIFHCHHYQSQYQRNCNSGEPIAYLIFSLQREPPLQPGLGKITVSPMPSPPTPRISQTRSSRVGRLCPEVFAPQRRAPLCPRLRQRPTTSGDECTPIVGTTSRSPPWGHHYHHYQYYHHHHHHYHHYDHHCHNQLPAGAFSEVFCRVRDTHWWTTYKGECDIFHHLQYMFYFWNLCISTELFGGLLTKQADWIVTRTKYSMTTWSK